MFVDLVLFKFASSFNGHIDMRCSFDSPVAGLYTIIMSLDSVATSS
jgi:hypothetical protein